MASPPTEIALGPAVPVSTDPEETFDAMFEAFLTWMRNQAAPGMNAAVANAYSNALEAHQAALMATGQAATAVGAVNAPMWAPGTFDAFVCRWSPTNGRTYRNKTAGVRNTDPALDNANWWDVVSLSAPPLATVGAGGGTAKLGFFHLITAPGTLLLPTDNLEAGVSLVSYLDVSLQPGVRIDPGPNRVRGALRGIRLDLPYCRGTLVWGGPSYGWV